jgi:hypothetical protein
LEFVLYVNNIERTCCVARHCAKFSSGTKYIRLANPIHYLEEEVVLNTINLTLFSYPVLIVKVEE